MYGVICVRPVELDKSTPGNVGFGKEKKKSALRILIINNNNVQKNHYTGLGDSNSHATRRLKYNPIWPQITAMYTIAAFDSRRVVKNQFFLNKKSRSNINPHHGQSAVLRVESHQNFEIRKGIAHYYSYNIILDMAISQLTNNTFVCFRYTMYPDQKLYGLI